MGNAPGNEIPKFGADRPDESGVKSQAAVKAQLEALRDAAPNPEVRQEVQKKLAMLETQEDTVTQVSAKQRNALARQILIDRESQGPGQAA